MVTRSWLEWLAPVEPATMLGDAAIRSVGIDPQSGTLDGVVGRAGEELAMLEVPPRFAALHPSKRWGLLLDACEGGSAGCESASYRLLAVNLVSGRVTSLGAGNFDPSQRSYAALTWLPSDHFALLTGSDEPAEHELMVFSVDCSGDTCGPISEALYASGSGRPVGRMQSSPHGPSFAILRDQHGRVPLGYGFDRMEPTQGRTLEDLFQ